MGGENPESTSRGREVGLLTGVEEAEYVIRRNPCRTKTWGAVLDCRLVMGELRKKGGSQTAALQGVLTTGRTLYSLKKFAQLVQFVKLVSET